MDIVFSLDGYDIIMSIYNHIIHWIDNHMDHIYYKICYLNISIYCNILDR